MVITDKDCSSAQEENVPHPDKIGRHITVSRHLRLGTHHICLAAQTSTVLVGD